MQRRRKRKTPTFAEFTQRLPGTEAQLMPIGSAFEVQHLTIGAPTEAFGTKYHSQ